ncbi:MAG: class I SAM-dependent methyltransferase [Verrucomicrobia bacterium]|nr:class I SAM-dependent methyltransferase [Verrucomicrobiota bacterium]
MNNCSHDNSFVYEGKDLEAMSFAQNYHNWIYENIETELGTKIAEIGSGVGNFTEFLLRNEHARIDAYEPCAKMHLNNKFSKNPRVNCINSNFELVSKSCDNKYDSVIFINVLEHIQQDSDAIKKAYKIIRRGGTLIIFVPALQVLYSNFDRSIGHYRRYQKSQLIKLAQNASFKIISCEYFDSIGIIPWFVFMKVMRRGLSIRNTLTYDTFVVPWLKIVEKIISPPLGKNLLLTASKV